MPCNHPAKIIEQMIIFNNTKNCRNDGMPIMLGVAIYLIFNVLNLSQRSIISISPLLSLLSLLDLGNQSYLSRI